MDQNDMGSFIEEIKSRALFENLPQIVTKCMRTCVSKYDQMYLDPKEEQCVRDCYTKNFDFQQSMNQELGYLARNLQ